MTKLLFYELYELYINIWIWWIYSWTNVNPWIWTKGKPWTMNMNMPHSYELVNFKSEKSVNPLISFFFKSMNPWIWKLALLWTHEYEYQYFHEPVNMNMYTLLYELFKVHTGHEIPWTISWTPWIVMRGKWCIRSTNEVHLN